MIAMLIMIIGLLGLLQALIYAADTNAKNLLRDEAVQVSDSMLNLTKAKPFGLLSTVYATKKIQSNIRKGVTFNADITTSPLGIDSSKLIVKVAWTYKGLPNQTELVSIKSGN